MEHRAFACAAYRLRIEGIARNKPGIAVEGTRGANE